MTPQQAARLINAADELHRLARDRYDKPEWLVLGEILDEVKPLTFKRTTGETIDDGKVTT